jgi:hypothetical protein
MVEKRLRVNEQQVRLYRIVSDNLQLTAIGAAAYKKRVKKWNEGFE